MKYITNIHHLDYWWSVYSIGIYTPEKAVDVEFWITNDEEGNDEYFQIGLYNLSFMDYLIASDEYMKRNDKRYNAFIRSCNKLRAGKIEYFIGTICYRRNGRTGNGHDYLSMNKSLNKKTLFQMKNKMRTKPFYATIFISEPNPLFPETVVKWIEKLSMMLFGEQIQCSFAETEPENRESVLMEYEERLKTDDTLQRLIEEHNNPKEDG
jgi:hypothetical protein